jgi:uncharacterized protein (UPF0264 family)
MAALLVSVRSVPEAEAALAGGAALIDIKEPSRGSLGRADEEVVRDIIRRVDGRRPVSAALGEFLGGMILPTPRLRYCKCGLAGCGLDSTWRSALAEWRKRLGEDNPPCGLVPVAYADWRRAHSPPPSAIVRFAAESRCAGVLLDTWKKDGTTLLAWLSIPEIDEVCRNCRSLGLTCALAGSLGLAEIEALRHVEPDWFAVRGAACRDGGRDNAIDARRVHRLAQLLAGSAAPLPEVNALHAQACTDHRRKD